MKSAMVRIYLPVLRATSIGSSKGMHIQCVNGTEVSSHSAKLLSIDRVEKSGFELALRSSGRGHILSILTTTQQDVRVSGRNHSSVHGSVGPEHLDHLQSVGINQLGVTVSGSSDDHTLVSVEVQAAHSVRVNLLSQHLLASLGIVLHNVARIEASNDELVSNGPAQAGGLVVIIHRDNKLGSVQRSGIILLTGD